jgi:hypothetical protein
MTVTGHHRKALIRAWRRPSPRTARRRRRRGRARRYGPAAVRALKAIWTVAGYPWSARLKALLPLWLPWARKRLSLSKAIETQVRQIRARQIDRVLAPDKRRIRRRMYGRTKPGSDGPQARRLDVVAVVTRSAQLSGPRLRTSRLRVGERQH